VPELRASEDRRALLEAPPIGVSRRGRVGRLLATAAVFGALLAGTIWGDDVHFPFGPFRMYASTEPLDGVTSWYVLEVVTADGDTVAVAPEDLGLRRAEVEGRVAEMVQDPTLVAGLARRYEARHAGPSLRELRVVRRNQPMHAGQPEGAPFDEVVVAWSGR
jgi:hypothetical protein